MKIGILTQPLYNNYGGLLQNYALQQALSEMGHDPITVNIVGKKYKRPHVMITSLVRRAFLKAIGRDVVIRVWPNKKESETIGANTRRFVERNIKTTKKISQKVDKNMLETYAFDAYIIGSDQVWRPKYSPQISSYFLDFLKSNPNVKKLTYAASFGVSDWEFTDEQTEEFSKLLKLFDGVSVREDSAVSLCEKYFGITASHVLDPTMLLDKENYTSLVEKEEIGESEGDLFTYILDDHSDKGQIVNSIAAKYCLKDFSVLPQKAFSDPGRKDITDCVYPPLEKWIRGFMDAKFVVTDSFHGTAFSILFNKPFISIANKNRGTTRFTSLLKLFGLEDRLIFSLQEFDSTNINKIEWEKVNSILNQEKLKSIQILKKYLGDNK